MKIIRSLVFSVFAAGAVSVQALPIIDIHTPEGGVAVLQTGVSYTFEHNLLDDGFDPDTDQITSATLTFEFGSRASGNAITVAFDGSTITYSKMGDIDGIPLEIDVALLQVDGLLSISLTKGGGNGSTFDFVRSTLLVNGSSGTAVPEPASLALFSAGLLGLGLMRRRSKS